MTACIFAGEERAADSSRFLLDQISQYTEKWAT